MRNKADLGFQLRGDQAGLPEQAWIILVVGALISFLGVPAGLIGNELSILYGLRNIATLVFLLSAIAGGLFGFTAMLPYIAVLGLSVVVGFIVQGNFSNLTSGVLAVAAPRHRGATFGLYSCIGFGAGFLGTLPSVSHSTNSAGLRCSLTSPCLGSPLLSASSSRDFNLTSGVLAVAARGIEEQHSGFIRASALAPGFWEPCCSVSHSTNSAGLRTSPPGSGASVHADSLA